MLQFIKKLSIVVLVLFGLALFTKGRLLNALLFLSLLAVSLSLAFLIPVFIANAIATVYEHLDPDLERRNWISACIRGLGIIEGGRNVFFHLHPHGPDPYHRDRGHDYH